MGDMGWRNMLQPRQVLLNVHGLYSKAYPARIHRIVILNISWIMQKLFHLTQRYIAPKVLARYVMVGKDENVPAFLQALDIPPHVLPQQWDGGTMDFDALQLALQQRLRDRYELEAQFTLS